MRWKGSSPPPRKPSSNELAKDVSIFKGADLEGLGMLDKTDCEKCKCRILPQDRIHVEGNSVIHEACVLQIDPVPEVKREAEASR